MKFALILALSAASFATQLAQAEKMRPQSMGAIVTALEAAGLVGGALLFGLGTALAAVMPNYWLFGIVLVLVGVSVQTFNTTSNSTVQLSTDPEMRGRVMAIVLAIALGGTPIGAPLVGWVADRFGARWSLAVGAASGVLALMVGVHYLVRHRGLRVRVDAGRLRFSLDKAEPAVSAAA